GVAGAAKLRRAIAKGGEIRIGNAVHAVTVHTGGDVRVAFLQQRLAVNTVAVFLEDRAVALPAGDGDAGARLVRRFYVMGAVAIGTDGGVFVAFGERVAVHVVECRLVFLFVTLGAHRVVLQPVLAQRLGHHRLVGEAVTLVAIDTLQQAP